jgi:hypothetical protein
VMKWLCWGGCGAHEAAAAGGRAAAAGGLRVRGGYVVDL